MIEEDIERLAEQLSMGRDAPSVIEESCEIEITPEMIEAGRDKVYTHISGLISATDSSEAEEAARDIFCAMIRARRHPAKISILYPDAPWRPLRD